MPFTPNRDLFSGSCVPPFYWRGLAQPSPERADKKPRARQIRWPRRRIVRLPSLMSADSPEAWRCFFLYGMTLASDNLKDVAGILRRLANTGLVEVREVIVAISAQRRHAPICRRPAAVR